MTVVLWAVFAVLVAVAAAGLTIPLIRRYDGAAREGDAVTAVLRDQLAEVDIQAASGQVGAGETEALRTEIKRRLLVESRARPVPVRLLSDRGAARGGVALAVVVGLAATGLYAVLGRPDLTAPAAPATIAAEVAEVEGLRADGQAAPDATGAAVLIGQLETRMAQAPSDPEGWRLLGAAYFQTQRYADATTAYAKAAKLDPNKAGYASALGEARVQAAGGVVTSAAQTAFADARGRDPNDFRARYFLALARDQAGDHRGAVDAWLTLLREASPSALWVPGLRRFVRQVASDAHIDLAGRLPADGPPESSRPPDSAEQKALAPMESAPSPGPTAADAASVAALPPAERQAFVRKMVASLAAKLKANPRDAGGWIRLIRAYAVIGDGAAARTALRDAKAAFADAPQSRAAIVAGAASAGVS